LLSKRIWRIFAADLAVLLAITAVLEGVLRVSAPIYGKQLFDNEYTGSFPMDMNPEGYRGPLIPKEKPPGELRVLGLGDSVTFGTGVPTDETWPAQLAEALSAKAARPVVAINAGLEGSSVESLIYAWDKQWAAYHPDLVVLAMTGNMVSLEVANGGKLQLPTERYASLHQPLSALQQIKIEANRDTHMFCVPSFLSIETQRLLYWDGLLNHDIDPHWPYGAVLAHGWRQGDLDPTLADTAWERLAATVRRLDERVEASGAKLVLTYIAPRFTLTSATWDNQKNMPVERFSIDPLERSRAVADRLGVHYVDSRGALLAERLRIEAAEHRSASMYIYFDYAHLNGDGHRALAQALARDF
jgi:lysophospholipase L1-like esterase